MNNNQNESPFSNPRFIVSIIVVFLFLWGWQYYVNKAYPPVKAPTTQSKNQQNTDSAATNAVAGVENLQQSIPQTSGAENQEALKPQANLPETVLSYEDDQIKWQLSSKGMSLSNIELKKYFDKDKKPIIFGFIERTLATKINNQDVFFDLKKVSEVQFVGTALIDGTQIKRIMTYYPETMSFDLQTQFDVTPQSLVFEITDRKIKIDSGNFLMPSFEHQNFLYKNNEKVFTEHIGTLRDGENLNVSANLVSLASLGTQYFTQAYIDKSDVTPSIQMLVTGNSARLVTIYDLKNTKLTEIKSKYYVGPKLVETLQKVDPILPEVMDYGMFGFISKPLLSLMKAMHDIFGNWGLAIVALTIIMRIIVLPFNILSFRSARAMQRIQPQLQAVREKYKNDPMAVNRETMALMKENNANPLSSCLPMLIQIPIFFALWKTIGSSIEIYQQPFFGWITDLSSHDSFFVLPVLMGVTMYFQQKMTPTTMDPMQQKILNFMPILFSLFMLSLPSGLTLYNFISSLFGVVQQYFLLKDNKT